LVHAVSGRSGRAGCCALAIFLIAGTPAAVACGFENPKSAQIARGVLNWAFPQALHVTSAVWAAQLEGLIDRAESTTGIAPAFVSSQRAGAKLAAVRNSLAATVDAKSAPNVSIVLLGPMLWTRFVSEGSSLSMTVHSAGPAKDDVVIVTDEPVIAALLDGRMTPHVARDRGLLRLYGPAEAVEHATKWLDRWPEKKPA
jgi:hypothetical protein